MNEVRISNPVQPIAARPASSKGGDAEIAAAAGNSLPLPGTAEPASAPVDTGPAATSAEQVKTAVASISEYVQSVNRDLQFTVDEELDRTVIKVIDSRSGELIRQIPEEVFLELARKLNDDGEFQLIDALG